MAALTNVRDTSELGGKYIALPVKGATTIYQGSIVAVDATGYAIPGKKATGLKAAGRAEETVGNKGGVAVEMGFGYTPATAGAGA